MAIVSYRGSPAVRPRCSIVFTLAAVLVPALALAQTGTVSGTVTNSATLAPVQNVNVTLCPTSTTAACSGTLTNASGAYSITLAAATYVAYTSGSGLINQIFDHLPCQLSACDAGTAIATGAPIVVTAGGTAAGRNFVLDPGTSLSGMVTNAATGTPIQSARVAVWASIAGNPVFVAAGFTNASGAYSVGGLTTGVYYAFTTAIGLGYSNQIYGGILCPYFCSASIAIQSGVGVPVVAGTPTTGTNFALEPGGQITGTVVNAATSTPLAGVSVNVFIRAGGFFRQVASAITNASGVYTIIGVPHGAYYVQTSAAGFVNQTFNNIPCAGPCELLPSPGSPVQVNAGSTTAGIDFDLDAGGSISGTVTETGTGTPLPGTNITVLQRLGGSVLQVASPTTDALGQYTVPALPTGTYFVLTASTSHLNKVYANLACGLCDDPTLLSNAMPVNVVSGTATSGKDFVLDVGGGISGTVTDTSTSSPSAFVTVDAFTTPNGEFAGETTSDASGVWAIGGLPSGSYVVTTRADFTLTRYMNGLYNSIPCLTFCSGSAAAATGTPITVTAGVTTTGIGLSVAPATVPDAPASLGATVSGYAVHLFWSTSPYGALPTSYLLEAGFASGTTAVTIPTTTTTLDVPGVPPGTYYLRVLARNAVAAGPASTEYVLTVNADGSGVLQAPQSLLARVNDRRLTITWGDAGIGGVPTGYQIEAGTATGLANIATVPVTSRSFTFEPLPDGVYFLRVRTRNGAQVSPPSRELMIVAGNVPSPPDPPFGFQADAIGHTVQLYWLRPLFGDPTSYIIEAGSASGLADLATVDTNSLTTFVRFSGIPSGTYYIRLRAVNALGVGPVSGERMVVIP